MKQIVLVLLLLGLAGPPLSAEILERILVKVNGEIITQTDLEQRQVSFLRQQQNRAISEADLDQDEQLKKILIEITPRILADAIDEMLIVQRGRELGYRMTDEQFRNILDQIKKENNIQTEEQFQEALRQEGMTMVDLRRALERQMLIQRVQQSEVVGRINITEIEAQEFYEAHPEQFTTPATVTLREILISVPGVGGGGDPNQALFSAGLDEQARERAEAVRERVVSGGEDFAQVASEVSDAPSKENAGLIGPINRDELAPALLEILDKLQTGEVSEIIRTPRGYQILKLEAATAAGLQPFETVRDRIADHVYQQKMRAHFERYVQRLRAQAIIEWKSDELRKAYEQHVAASPAPVPS
jgi:peptidyl-prolyl cis-trans isomerase SurA